MLAAAYDLALVRTDAFLEPGLSESELQAVEDRYGFTFAREHRLMLSIALPLDAVPESPRPVWPNWRQPDQYLDQQVAWPVQGVLGAVARGSLWLDDWPPKPSSTKDAVDIARIMLERAPRLVPVHAYMYLPDGDWAVRGPLVSVYESDVFIFNEELLDWLERRCRCSEHDSRGEPVTSLPLWSAIMQRTVWP